VFLGKEIMDESRRSTPSASASTFIDELASLNEKTSV
jgi:hypothetical protein